jgi:threonine dehydrogenase-like Zn-dependent dehydrogenase
MGGVGMAGGPGVELDYAWLMRSCITVHGQWMYPREAPVKMVGMVRSGLIRLQDITPTTFSLDQINEAVDHAAANAGPFKMTVVCP